MAETQHPPTAQLVPLRRWQAQAYGVAALAIGRKAKRTPRDLARWVYERRQECGVYADRARRWGEGSCGPVAAPLLPALHFLGALAGHDQTPEGCRIVIGHPPEPLRELFARWGIHEQDGRQYLQAYWTLVARAYGLRPYWESTRGNLGLHLRCSAGATPAGVWTPGTPEQQAAAGRRLVARSLAVLLGYAAECGQLPEQVGRLCSARLGSLLLPAGGWDRGNRAGVLARAACALHLGVLDQAGLQAEPDGWRVQSPPLPPETAGMLEVYRVLPHDLGRFWNGLLGHLGARQRLRVACELGHSTFTTWIGEQ